MMEDRFKFRVWFEGRFIYKSLCDSNVYTEDDKCICLANSLPDLPWEQCASLKDKNGKLIYEGDIVKAPLSYKYEIKWSDGNWGLFFGNGQYDICLCERASKEVEIIGNIHENAELLGEE